MERCISRRTARGSSGLRGWLGVAGLGFIAASSSAFAFNFCGGLLYPFPYTDVSGVGAPFCPGIMQAYVTGISKGTSPTTFSPDDDVPRLQMTTFLQRTVDQVLTRGRRRAALKQWWVPQAPISMQTIVLTSIPYACAADGENIWTTDGANRVNKIEASTGTNLDHWTGAVSPNDVLVAAGKVFVTGGGTVPGSLYVIDPTLPSGPVTVAASNLGAEPFGIAFDGTQLWTANAGIPGSVSIITPAPTTPYPPGNVTTVTAGFLEPVGILYDGANIWVTDFGAGTLLKLDPSGNILQTVPVGSFPQIPVFDGTNIWVPNESDNSVSVVQASTGNVVATITQGPRNKLNRPVSANFDGERVLVTNTGNNTVTVFKAADLSFIANVSTGPLTPAGGCSDGINFWITANDLLRF
jgi:YVTN family beta-propeller protein